MENDCPNFGHFYCWNDLKFTILELGFDEMGRGVGGTWELEGMSSLVASWTIRAAHKTQGMDIFPGWEGDWGKRHIDGEVLGEFSIWNACWRWHH